MGVKLWINRNKIYLSIYHNKKLWRESTGLTVSSEKAQNKEVMRMAEVLRSKREMQLAAAVNGLLDSERGRATLTEYIKEMAALKTDVSEKQTLKVVPYLEKYGGNIKVSAVTPQWFEQLKANFERDTTLKSNNTKAKYLGVVRQALKKAVREHLLPNDPADGIQGIRTHDGNRAYLTVDEIKAMVDCEYKQGTYSNEIRPAFFLALLTGLRISDTRMLRWKNINVTKNETGEVIAQIVKQQKKTDEFVYLPMPASALPVIGWKDGLPQDDFIFPSLASVDDISFTNRYIKSWAEAAGIKKIVTWHVARHTYATMLIENGADIYTVQKLLGHTHVQTTQKYAKVTDRKKTAAVAALPDYGIK